MRLVLIAEDHDDTRFLLRYMFESRGARVIEVSDGAAAVEAARQHSPDLILMDGQLPNLDGCAATRRIRQNEDSRHTPVVYLSGYDSPFHAAAAKSAGCDEYILKPFELKSIDRVFKLYLGGRDGDGAFGE